MTKTLFNAALFVFLIITASCKQYNSNINYQSNTMSNDTLIFDDSKYVLNKDYKHGDVRRYGVFPDSIYSWNHPILKAHKMDVILDLAEFKGVKLFFPKGYYETALILDSRENINIKFDSAEFDVIHITHNSESKKGSKNIVLEGTVISYDRLGITEAEDIKIDSVFIKSDINKNLRGIRSRGCHIYHGNKNIQINYLYIEDFGSGDIAYEHNHAALAIDGYANNPINVRIKDIYIKSTDRHGIYITGSNHKIGNVVIDKYGIGSSKDMSGMQDSDKGEEKDFKALWVNRCYNSSIESITINEKDSKGKYTAHFDEGDLAEPVIIRAFKVINENPNISILKEINTGVKVETME